MIKYTLYIYTALISYIIYIYIYILTIDLFGPALVPFHSQCYFYIFIRWKLIKNGKKSKTKFFNSFNRWYGHVKLYLSIKILSSSSISSYSSFSLSSSSSSGLLVSSASSSSSSFVLLHLLCCRPFLRSFFVLVCLNVFVCLHAKGNKRR